MNEFLSRITILITSPSFIFFLLLFLDSLGFTYEINSKSPGIVSDKGEYIPFENLKLPSEYLKE